jgi:hypothetical protein
MLGRLGAALVIALMLIAGLVAVGAPPSAVSAAEMCPPVTLDDLYPPPTSVPAADITTATTPDTTTPDTTTTTRPTTTSDTRDTGSSTVPETTTTVTAPPPQCEPFHYGMLWPLAGAGQIISGFGADRDNGARHHKGVDISAPRLTPVVSVADGVVIKVVQEVGTEECCWVAIRHSDGWQSFYIHLNNDRHGTDDGLGTGVRPDLAPGVEVLAGEVIGWVGDSGNAEGTIDHLHFELRTPAGVAVDAGSSLKTAQKKAALHDPQPAWPYADDDGFDSEWLAARWLSEGLFLPCDETMVNFCPDAVASPEFAMEMGTYFAGRSAPPLQGRYQSVPFALDWDFRNPTTHEQILGCEPLSDCLDFGIPETELARIAVWARVESLIPDPPFDAPGLSAVPGLESAAATWLPSAVEAEAALRSDGGLDSCNGLLDDERLLTREEALTRMAAWVRGFNPYPCPGSDQPVR